MFEEYHYNITIITKGENGRIVLLNTTLFYSIKPYRILVGSWPWYTEVLLANSKISPM